MNKKTGCTKYLSVGIATALHLLVDGLCACSLYLMADASGTSNLLALFLTYNILAFMSQPLTGWWVDRLNQKQPALLIAIGLLTTAVILQLAATAWWGFNFLSMLTIAVLLGLGNSLFHVWGGKTTVLVAGNDMRFLGVFVSSGVMGLTLGVLYASWWMLAGMLLLINLLGVLYLSRFPQPQSTTSFLSPLGESEGASSLFTLHSSLSPQPLASDSPSIGGGRGEAFLLLILLFVMLRAFVGEAISAGLEKPSEVLLLMAATAMIGKAGGGWVARAWNIRQALVLCVGITAACMMLRTGNAPQLLPVLLGIFAINCTMPMTLCLANRLLPRCEGLAFGLLAAVLIPGYLLATNLHLTPNHHFMLSALLLTIAVELGMLMLMGEKRKKVLVGAIFVNILTNVPLNIYLLTNGISTEAVIVGEVLVLIVEALWYFWFVRKWSQACIYSLLCNATSFLAGILIQLIPS